jgi:flagellar basal body-associated protein FliL
MAPHDTNPKREARRHAFPLIGIVVLLAIVAVGFFWFVSSQTTSVEDDRPAAEDVQVTPPETR